MDENSYIKKHQEKIKSFYAPYFAMEADLDDFVSDAFDYENGSLPKRQMHIKCNGLYLWLTILTSCALDVIA